MNSMILAFTQAWQFSIGQNSQIRAGACGSHLLRPRKHSSSVMLREWAGAKCVGLQTRGDGVCGLHATARCR